MKVAVSMTALLAVILSCFKHGLFFVIKSHFDMEMLEQLNWMTCS